MTTRTRTILPLLFVAALGACGDSGESGPSASPLDDPREPATRGPLDPAVDESAGTPPETPAETPIGVPDAGPGSVAPPRAGDDGSPIAEPADLHERDGYGSVDMLRVDIRTVTAAGPCTVDDESGCTLADVIADVDPDDELKVDIPVHFTAGDFPDDGRETNAELRQRGRSARLDPRKSFRVELKGQGVRWRGEDRLQINKHPYDPSLIRNKVAFDLMSGVPNLPSIRTQFVNLWIDDGAGPVDYGVFTHDEAAGDEFLENRGWDEDGRLYKAEKFLFSREDLDFLAIDDEGKPLDKDRFESRLEIENGKDHRPLLAMVRALGDGARSFESVLAEFFDEDNVMTYVAVNLLLGQPDATTHNFFLYNPSGSERFYYLPWDYDLALDAEDELVDGFATDALASRLHYGFGKGGASVFLQALYRSEGFHEKLLAKVDELRNGPLSDAVIADLASRYTAVVAPVAARGPERFVHKPEQADAFVGHVRSNEAGLRSGFLPLAPGLTDPRVRDDRVEFRWSPAVDVTGRRTITYDLEVASSPAFGPGERVYFESGIADDPTRVRVMVPLARLGSGRHVYRVVARVDEDPSRLWITSVDRRRIDGETWIGMREFVLP